jgi:outer membrane receptor protein involved in Fe transport
VPTSATGTSTLLGAEEAYDVFDLTGSWNVSDRTAIRFGLENLLDMPPVWTGAIGAGRFAEFGVRRRRGIGRSRRT